MPDRIRRRRRTKIVATLGPASSSAEMLAQLFQLGADVFRLNFSHGTHEEHAAQIELIRSLERRFRRPIAILADVQGPKLRIGQFQSGRVVLQAAQQFTLDLNPAPGDARRVCLPHPEIFEAAQIGTTLLLDDGKLRLRVLRKRSDHLLTEIVNGGTLSDHKGVNIPDVELPIPALTEKDLDDLAFVLPLGIDYIGLSFVQRPEDVARAKEIAAGRAAVMPKLEKPQALENLEAILELADAVMVARGDLGVELPPEEVPVAQKRILRAAQLRGVPVVVATQMLESMVSSPSPTRAEASDVANAVYDGADAVMLSAESAAGQFPREAVSMMDHIIVRVERDADWRLAIDTRRPAPEKSSADALAAAATQVAHTIGAAAIVAFTQSGSTAYRIAREKPDCPVLGLTPNRTAARRLALLWGVHALVIGKVHSMTEATESAVRATLREGFAKKGNEIVVIAGVPFGEAGTTNALRIARL
jgi:pyruvate kinase